MGRKKIIVEIQHFEGCPNSPVLIARVKEAMKDSRTEIQYTEVLVESNEKAIEVGFRGSPTLLINGKDIEDLPIPENPALMCRYYPKGLPTVGQIIAALDLLNK